MTSEKLSELWHQTRCLLGEHCDNYLFIGQVPHGEDDDRLKFDFIGGTSNALGLLELLRQGEPRARMVVPRLDDLMSHFDRWLILSWQSEGDLVLVGTNCNRPESLGLALIAQEYLLGECDLTDEDSLREGGD